MDPGVAFDVPDPHRLPWSSSLRAFWGASNATGHVEPNLWALTPVARLRNHIWRWGPHTGWSRPHHRSSGCIQRPWSPPRTRSRSWSLLNEVQNSPWRAVLLYSPSVDAKVKWYYRNGISDPRRRLAPRRGGSGCVRGVLRESRPGAEPFESRLAERRGLRRVQASVTSLVGRRARFRLTKRPTSEIGLGNAAVDLPVRIPVSYCN